MATKLEVLENIPLFAALSKRQRRKLLRGMRVFDYEPGHAIVRQGDEGETMFVVLEGEAESSGGVAPSGSCCPATCSARSPCSTLAPERRPCRR